MVLLLSALMMLITSDKITAKVHSDNYEFGRQCGEFLGNALKDVDNAKVIVLDGTAGTTTDTEPSQWRR